MNPIYKNYEHYINEKSSTIKKSFLFLDKKLSALEIERNARLLDIGCAAGELIRFLKSRYPDIQYVGIDIFDDLLAKAKEEVSDAYFENVSVLDISDKYNNVFDLITVFGVIGIFDDKNLDRFFSNILSWLKPGGRCYIFEPFNNYGMDLISKHRKTINGVQGDWELGNSVFSIETVKRLLNGRCKHYSFDRFDIGMPLKRSSDPQRTWTIECEDNKYQLTNGLKLLFDIYLLEIIK